LPSIPRV